MCLPVATFTSLQRKTPVAKRRIAPSTVAPPLARPAVALSPSEASTPEGVGCRRRLHRRAQRPPVYDPDAAYEPGAEANDRRGKSLFRSAIVVVLERQDAPLPWMQIFRLIEKDREAMGILSASRGKTLSNSVCATFQKDTGKTQPEMYAKGWGKCTVGKHFVKFHTGAKSLFHLLERFEHLLEPLGSKRCERTPALTRYTSLNGLSCPDHHEHEHEHERVVRQRSCPLEELMTYNFDLLAHVLHSNPSLQSPQKAAERPLPLPLLHAPAKTGSKQSQPNNNEQLDARFQQLAVGGVL